MKFDGVYYSRMDRECQVVLPARLIYLRTALAHASLASCYRDTYTHYDLAVQEERMAYHERLTEINVKLYREERGAVR
jgi:hypothetical protein